MKYLRKAKLYRLILQNLKSQAKNLAKNYEAYFFFKEEHAVLVRLWWKQHSYTLGGIHVGEVFWKAICQYPATLMCKSFEPASFTFLSFSKKIIIASEKQLK